MARLRRSIEPLVSARVREVRLRTFGPNGATRFAHALGVHPSTYRFYESVRPPPMPILLRISELTGEDPRWLLTGQFRPVTPDECSFDPSPRARKILARFAERVRRRAGADRALTALLDLLDDAAAVEPCAPPRLRREESAVLHPDRAIPVLGRTAAGIPHFWSDPSTPSNLLDPIVRGRRPARQTPAVIDATSGPSVGVAFGPRRSVHLMQFSRPMSIAGVSVCEYLSVPDWPAAMPHAFALRVDGDSMAPVIRHGDFVIVSPNRSACDAHAAVVQLQNQVGLSCKLFRRVGDRVHLIPINAEFPITRHCAAAVVWALAVLCRVRLHGSTASN